MKYINKKAFYAAMLMAILLPSVGASAHGDDDRGRSDARGRSVVATAVHGGLIVDDRFLHRRYHDRLRVLRARALARISHIYDPRLRRLELRRINARLMHLHRSFHNRLIRDNRFIVDDRFFRDDDMFRLGDDIFRFDGRRRVIVGDDDLRLDRDDILELDDDHSGRGGGRGRR